MFALKSQANKFVPYITKGLQIQDFFTCNINPRTENPYQNHKSDVCFVTALSVIK